MIEHAQSTGRRPRSIIINTDDNVVMPDRIFVHQSRKGFVCVGIGAGAELMARAERLASRPAAKLGLMAGHITDPYLERLDRLAKEYNPEEARVPAGARGAGEWTTGGIVANAASAAANLFEADSPSVLAGLATIASRLSAPTAFLGTLFIPTNRSLISSGAVPGNAAISFQFDRGEGVLTLSRSDDGSVLFSGRYGADGIFRDNNGNALGRVVDGAVVLDPDSLPGYASSSRPAQSRAGAQAQTDTDRDEPELCPDPTIENTNGRKERGLQYQEQISRLPRGFDVQLNGVRFDGCRDSDGTMLEAKGPGYLEHLLRNPAKYPWLRMQSDMLDQASRQVAAAGDRTIEWHFAEEGVADYMRTLFAKRRFKILVIYTPPQ